MVRKSKVELSDHYEEIHGMLLHSSSRVVSRWLKETYGEDISYRTLERYKNKHIRMEERVEAELNKRAAKREKVHSKSASDMEKKTTEAVKSFVDKKEATEEASNEVASVIATNMQGVGNVGAQFEVMFHKACNEAKDPDSNVSYKDIARLALDADKFYSDYFKQEVNNLEVNIDNNLDLGKAFNEEKMRSILNAKRGRDK